MANYSSLVLDELLEAVTNDLREFGGLGVQSFQSRLYFGEPIDELFLGLAIFFILFARRMEQAGGRAFVPSFSTRRHFRDEL